jgi:hypothetical protein
MRVIRIILHGKAQKVFRTLAKLVVADRLLENKFGKPIELLPQHFTPGYFKEREN